jgi:hypothetical protein
MDYLLRALAWAWAHREHFVATSAALVLLARAVPAAQWQRLERDWPRAANLVRLLRAIAPDLAKALRVIVAIWTGRPWDALPPPAPAASPANRKEAA